LNQKPYNTLHCMDTDWMDTNGYSRKIIHWTVLLRLLLDAVVGIVNFGNFLTCIWRSGCSHMIAQGLNIAAILTQLNEHLSLESVLSSSMSISLQRHRR